MKQKRFRIGIFTQLEHTIQREVVQSLISFSSQAYGWDFELPRPLGAPWTTCQNNPLDGVIAWPAVQNLPFLRRLKVPVVCLGSSVISGFPNVSFDNKESGRMAARYFIERGFRRLVMLTGEKSLFCKLRAEGFQQAAHTAKAECKIFYVNKYSKNQAMWSRFATNLKQWLDKTSQPAGLLTDTALTGFLALPVIRQAGIRVPEELSILTVGSDSILCETSTPALSSIVIPGVSMGVEVAKLLQSLLLGERRSSNLIMLPPTRIVERDSSNILYVGDEIVTRALKLINEHASTPFTIADLLKAVPASRRSLEIRFKKAIGRTLQKEIWRVHLEKAKQLLAETQFAMPDVAEGSGFADAQRLSEIFKRELKESPTSYRKRCQISQK